MPDFLKTLRVLDAGATAAPWEHDSGDGRRDVFQESTGEMVTHAEGGDAPTDTANAALLVLLRNHAARIAAVVEAAGAIVEDLGDGTHVVRREHIGALRAALAALEAP